MSGAGFDIIGPLLDVPLPSDALLGLPPSSLFGTQVATRPVDDDGVDGDLTGDGLDDIVIGQGSASSIGRARNGVVWVIRGKADTNSVDLTASPSTFPAGWRIAGGGGHALAGQDTALVGDINGDGRGDVALTSPGTNAAARSNAGTAYVVYGKNDGTEVDLNSSGAAAMTIYGGAAFQLTNISAAGDVDGDLVPDVLIGGYGGWVIFGNPGLTLDLANLDHQTGVNGYEIYPPDHTYAGVRADVSNASDQDGDFSTDALITFADVGAGSGSSYLVYGRPLSGDVDLANLGGNRGARITSGPNTYSGRVPGETRVAPTGHR